MSWTPVTPNTKSFQVLGATTLGYGRLDGPLQLLDYLLGGKPRVPGDWTPGGKRPADWTPVTTT